MRPLAAACALLTAAAVAGFGQGFGQNHVIRRDFEWKIRSTEHFDVYYYDDSEPLVGPAAKILEESFRKVNSMLNIEVATAASPAGRFPPWTRRPFFLYASPNDFQQSNIALVGPGTGGVTEPLKDRFMVYNDGTRQWLEEVIAHEFTHIMQFYVLISGFWKSARVLKAIIYPLWMMEGMPGWVTNDVEGTWEELIIRDAATSGGLLHLYKIERFGHLKPHQVALAYKQGAAAMDFIATQYGKRKVGEMLRLFEAHFETSIVLKELLGLDAFQFDKKYREFVETKYARIASRAGLREPSAFGDPLTRRDLIPQYNTSPVITSDGRTMYYLSTRRGYPPELWRADLRTGKLRKIIKAVDARVENVMLGNFYNLSRVLDISPDQRTLIFAGAKNRQDALYFYDFKTGALERRPLAGFSQISQPRYSPDGRTIVFSGMRRSFTDIYAYSVESGGVSRLTEDPRDDEMPAFTADGREVIYSSEIPDAANPGRTYRALFKVAAVGGRPERLAASPGLDLREPVPSADGLKVLLTCDGMGLSEICELDLATRRLVRMTRSIGGAFTPLYAPDGQIVFGALRRGDVHIYEGPRSAFMAEPVPESAGVQGGDAWAEYKAPPDMGEERRYAFNFSTDLFLPALFFASPGGLFTTAYWQGSDLVGNHQTQLLGSYSSSDSFFNYQASYAYGRYRPQLVVGAQGYGQRELFDRGKIQSYNEGLHAQYASVRYPFDRWHRVEGAVASVTDKAVYRSAPTVDQQSRILSAAFVRDTVTGRYLVPTRGNRLRLSYDSALLMLGGNRRYDVASVEAHQFIQTGSLSTLAMRVAGVEGLGRDKPGFILGGVGGVRGYERSLERNFGSRIAVANAELRFPILRNLDYYMWYFFPDFYFKAVFGSIFTDAGYAWNTADDLSGAHWRSLRHSVGVGLKVYTFILQEFPLLVAMDYARRTTDMSSGIFYVYLGTLF